MNDDWRLHLTADDEGIVDRLRDRLQESDVADELRERLPDGLVVSRDGLELFVYGASRQDVETARAILVRLADEHELSAHIELHRWHPEEERWEPPQDPLPTDAADREREHAARMAQEEQETAEQGYAEWEVRIELPTHHEAHELGERLEAEGIPNRRAWKWLRVGAATEDDAVALAERLRSIAPSDARIIAPVGSATEAWQEEHPLWWLGGLAN